MHPSTRPRTQSATRRHPGLPTSFDLASATFQVSPLLDGASRGLAHGAVGQPGDPACLSPAGKDHLLAPARETQRWIRQIIMCTASSGSTSSSRTSRFQVWKSSARASAAKSR